MPWQPHRPGAILFGRRLYGSWPANVKNPIEHGRFGPSLDLAFRIAAAFVTKIEEVFVPAADLPHDDQR